MATGNKTNVSVVRQNVKAVENLVNSDLVQERVREVLGARAPKFLSAILQVVRDSDMLCEAEPKSILGAAMTAAVLDLDISKSLGFAYIIPFREKQKDNSYKVKAQFQIGYKGLIQLCQRSGQMKTINVTDVRQGEIEYFDRMTGEIVYNWIQDYPERAKRKVIGYVAYFELTNGFRKNMFMSIEELNAHAKRFSQTFKKGFGLWKDDFDSMASKTVLKLLLSKYAPMSTEMATAINYDQAVAITDDGMELLPPNYVDNKKPEHNLEHEKISDFIKEANDLDELAAISGSLMDETHEALYKAKEVELKKKK